MISEGLSLTDVEENSVRRRFRFPVRRRFVEKRLFRIYGLLYMIYMPNKPRILILRVKIRYRPPMSTYRPLVDHKTLKMDSASMKIYLNMKIRVFRRTESEFRADPNNRPPLPTNRPLVDQKT